MLVLAIAVGAGAIGVHNALPGWMDESVSRSLAISAGESAEAALSGVHPTRVPRSDRSSRWHVGTEVVFELDYSNFMERMEDDSRLIATTASGTLTLTVVESSPEKRLLVGNAREVATSFEGDDVQADTGRLVVEDLEHPFYLELQPSGAVSGIWLRSGHQPRTDRFLRDLAAAFQFVMSEDSKANRWSTRERDAMGPFVAHYVRVEGGAEKRKDASQLPPGAPKGARVDGVARYGLDGDGFFVRVDVEEVITIPLGIVSFESQRNIHIQLKSERRVRVGAQDLSGYRRTPLDGEGTGVPSEELQRREDEELARGQTFQALSATLGELRPEGYSLQYDEARSRLVALLRTNADAVAECAKALRGDLDRGERAALLAALSEAGTPEAQAAIMELAKDKRQSLEARDQALIHASLTSSPSSETLDGIFDLAKDEDPRVRGQATLALGAAARKAAVSSDVSVSGAAARASADLVERFKRASSPEEQGLYTTALGNSGGPEALEVSKQALEADDDELRAQGANALRFVDDPQADQLLAGTLVGDPSAEVRSQALAAVKYREYSDALHAAVDRAARSDRDVSVRGMAMNVLGLHAQSSEKARQTLLWMRQNDPDAELRVAAAAVLEQG